MHYDSTLFFKNFICKDFKNMLKKIFMTALCLAFTGCFLPKNKDTDADKRAKLAILGASTGASIGYTMIGGSIAGRAGAGALGGLFGGLIGNQIAEIKIAPRDTHARRTAIFMALSEGLDGEAFDWHTSDNTNIKGTVVPVEQYADEHGRVCRRFLEVLELSGGRIEEEREGCLDPTGYWVAE